MMVTVEPPTISAATASAPTYRTTGAPSSADARGGGGRVGDEHGDERPASVSGVASAHGALLDETLDEAAFGGELHFGTITRFELRQLDAAAEGELVARF